MGEIKSALEKALERAEKLGRATPEELHRLEYVPKGNTLAARYLRGEKLDVKAELGKFSGELAGFVREGVVETLLRNVILPQSEAAAQTVEKAMEGLLATKREREKARKIADEIRNLFAYYAQAQQQLYVKLRQAMEGKLEEARLARGSQMDSSVRINVEGQPQFQEEWQRAAASIHAQYERALEEQKKRLQLIA